MIEEGLDILGRLTETCQKPYDRDATITPFVGPTGTVLTTLGVEKRMHFLTSQIALSSWFQCWESSEGSACNA